MKKLIILCLVSCCFLMSCSKKDKDKSDEAAQSKTVDLGEAAEESDEKAADDAQAKGKKPPKHRARGDEGEKGRRNGATPEEMEMARRNDEASKNPDGSSKRGKPAAQEEFEERQAAEAAKKAGEDAPSENGDGGTEPEAPEENLAANDGNADGFDFSDDDNVVDTGAQPPRAARPRESLAIEKYINIREFREQTGYSGALSQAWLVGQNEDARYSSARLATDNNTQLGFSIQIWRPGNDLSASKRFSDLYSQSFGGQKIKSVATEAFVAKHHKIVELGFYEKSKHATVLLSCSENICNQEELKSVALIIQRRL